MLRPFLLCLVVLSIPTLAAAPKQPPAIPADRFIDSIGVNIHLSYFDTVYGQYDKVIKPRLTELGVRHVRDGVPSLQQKVVIDRMNDLARSGIRTILIAGPRRSPEETLPSLKAVIDSVELVEGPNECDNAGINYKGKRFPEGLRLYQDDLYAAVKGDASTRHLPVVIASISDPEHSDAFGRLTSADFANTHCYADGGPPGFRWDWYMAKCGLNSDKPVIATESGYHNSMAKDPERKHWIPGVSEKAAGKYIPRLFLEYQLRGVVRTYYYELIDLFPNSKVADHNFGLLRNDGSPKPAFMAMKNLIDLLKDPGPAFTPSELRYELAGATPEVRQLLLAKRDGSFYLVLWQNARSYDTKTQTDLDVPAIPVTLKLQKPALRLHVFEPCVSRKATSVAFSMAELSVNVADHPAVIMIQP